MEDFSWHRIDRNLCVLPHAHVDDVCFVHFHFGSDDGHVRKGHQETAVGILNARNNVFAETYGQVADDALDGRNVCGLAQDVASASKNGFVLIELRARLFELRFELKNLCASRVDRGCCRVVRSLALIEILLGNKPILI